jgi:hypothetical protein
MEHPKAKGDRSTLAIMVALKEAGYDLLVPFGENTRFDLVIDDGRRLARVQCKTGRLRQGAVLFATCSCVFCPETRGVYLVPITHLQVKVQAALRVEPALNSQRVGIRFADDYLVATIDVDVTAEPGASAGGYRSSA